MISILLLITLIIQGYLLIKFLNKFDSSECKNVKLPSILEKGRSVIIGSTLTVYLVILGIILIGLIYF